MSELRLASVNGSLVVEYRAIDAHPVPYQVTIQRRTLTPDGEEFADGESEWQTVSVGDVVGLLRLDGPVGRWLWERTPVDCLPSRMASYSVDSPAILWNVNARRRSR